MPTDRWYSPMGHTGRAKWPSFVALYKLKTDGGGVVESREEGDEWMNEFF